MTIEEFIAKHGFTDTPAGERMKEDLEAIYTQGIVDFVSKMSADYRHHTARAVKEDVIVAISHFDIDPVEFYSDKHDQDVAKAEAAVYLLTRKILD